MGPIITSVQNSSVKEAVQLHRKKYREEKGLILIEGQNCLEEAIKAGLPWEAIYQREDATLHIDMPIEPTMVTEAVMARMATTDSPPPVLGVARYRLQAGQQFEPAHTTAMLGLVELQDPGNVGTLVRASCAFGVTAMVTIGPCADPTSPKVIRSALGMGFRLPWYSFDTVEAFRTAAESVPDLIIFGADAHQGDRFDQVRYGNHSILLLGSEAHGLPESYQAMIRPIHIPMSKQVESVNVAIAGAILLSHRWLQLNVESG